MDLQEVKRNLNKIVDYQGNTYQLKACILRLNKQGYYYQAELKDTKCNSLIICKLEDVQEAANEIYNSNRTKI